MSEVATPAGPPGAVTDRNGVATARCSTYAEVTAVRATHPQAIAEAWAR
ncbi:aldolase, partial [Streptomyces sp. SID10244]|nr:aldolase [Streptomyces sp. SID10244]